MAEMNQTNNAYCAFNANGSSRGASHSTATFRAAWRRSALILRGGSLDTINARLKKLKLPAVKGAGEDLPGGLYAIRVSWLLWATDELAATVRTADA